MTLGPYSHHPSLMIGLRNRVRHMQTVLHLRLASTGWSALLYPLK